MSDRYDNLDLSAEDFGNDKEIQKSRAARKAQLQLIHDSLALVCNEFNATTCTPLILDYFLSFRNLQATTNHSVQAVAIPYTLHVMVAEYYSETHAGRLHLGGVEEYLIGQLTFMKEYPATYIHKETIREKLENLILKKDLDFPEHKKFSRKFNVLTEEKNHLRELWRMKDLDALTAFPNMEIELRGNKALFRTSRKPVSLAEARQLCDLIKVLCRVLP